MSHYTHLSIVRLAPGVTVPAPDAAVARVDGPGLGGRLINFATWSRDGTRIAFTARGSGEPGEAARGPLELWVADVETGAARRVLSGLNTVFADYTWVTDDVIVALVIPPGRGPAPVRSDAPTGPRVEDNSGGAVAQARTYQDLLKDGADADLFDFYGESVPVLIRVHGEDADPEATSIAPPRLYTSVSPSPDGAFIAATWLERPYSTSLPAGRFPRVTELWAGVGAGVGGGKEAGAPLAMLARLPLADAIPIVMDSVRPGVRSLSWRPDKPSTLAWVEARDGGDPRTEPENGGPRDALYTASAADLAAALPPTLFAGTDWRCGGVAWGAGDLALVYESQYRTRRSRVWAFAPDAAEADPGAFAATRRLVVDRDYEDAYADPGSPAVARAPGGSYLLARPGGRRALLLQGGGAGPDGSRPFLDYLDVDTGATTRLWRSAPPWYESTASILSPCGPAGAVPLQGLRLLLSRESGDLDEPPQTHIVELDVDAAIAAARAAGDGGETDPGPAFASTPLTAFPHPQPALIGAVKTVLRYQRTDGVGLTATLHTPPGWDADQNKSLPCLVWLYPREFKTAESAGQMRTSPHEFAAVGPSSPLLHLARGYAVLEGPSIPIVAGAGADAEANDTYVEQLLAGAEAAVEAAVATGAVDRARIAVGGHSYGEEGRARRGLAPRLPPPLLLH